MIGGVNTYRSAGMCVYLLIFDKISQIGKPLHSWDVICYCVSLI